MQKWVAVLQAADAAARWHASQKRKGVVEEPYINHLLEVASLVAEATEGADPDLVIAALLHDAIEDQGITREQIPRRFGQEVADLVAEVSDDKSLPKAERKVRQVKTASGKSPRAKVLKLADKTSNLRAIATSPPVDWDPARKVEYITWARAVAKGLQGSSPRLESLFHQAAAEAEATVKGFELLEEPGPLD